MDQSDIPAGDGAIAAGHRHQVHLAVTDGPDGDQVVLAPQERETARRLKGGCPGSRGT